MLSLPFQSFVMNLSYLLEQDVYQREWGRGLRSNSYSHSKNTWTWMVPFNTGSEGIAKSLTMKVLGYKKSNISQRLCCYSPRLT